jgi:hypothetical protein
VLAASAFDLHGVRTVAVPVPVHRVVLALRRTAGDLKAPVGQALHQPAQHQITRPVDAGTQGRERRFRLGRFGVDGVREELLQILAAEGFAGRLFVYLGQLLGIDDGVPSPSSMYKRRCFTKPEFARVRRDFAKLATQYGFSANTLLPRPAATP